MSKVAADNPAQDLLRSIQRQLRENERIWYTFRDIEIGLIGASSLREMVSVLAREIPRNFLGVECMTLAWVDPDYEVARILEGEEGEALVGREFLPVTAQVFENLIGPEQRPLLGACPDALRRVLFPKARQQPASVAVAPLVLRGKLLGSLNQASNRPEHFSPSRATDLLEHLAAVVALCVDNAITREQLKRAGLTDALTGVANRRFFERRMEEEVERWVRHGQPLSCLLVDVDHFKCVNDTFGHLAGDRVLRELAGQLGRDRRRTDVLARYGGEEFVLLLPGVARDRAAQIAERVRQHVQDHCFALAEGTVPVTVSIGLACLEWGLGAPGVAEAGSWLFDQADKALYQAKNAGRNRVVVSSAPL